MTTPTETLRVLLTEAEVAADKTEKALETAVAETTQRVRDARAAHLEAVETRTNLRRACGLNADGTERKARARKAETTGGETDE